MCAACLRVFLCFYWFYHLPSGYLASPSSPSDILHFSSSYILRPPILHSLLLSVFALLCPPQIIVHQFQILATPSLPPFYTSQPLHRPYSSLFSQISLSSLCQPLKHRHNSPFINTRVDRVIVSAPGGRAFIPHTNRPTDCCGDELGLHCCEWRWHCFYMVFRCHRCCDGVSRRELGRFASIAFGQTTSRRFAGFGSRRWRQGVRDLEVAKWEVERGLSWGEFEVAHLLRGRRVDWCCIFCCCRLGCGCCIFKC